MSTITKKKTMTKKKLIQAISQEKNVHPKDVSQVIQAFLDKMIQSLADGGRLEFRDFGVFEVVTASRKSAAILKMLLCLSSFLNAMQ